MILRVSYRHRKRNRGASLVELLIVLTILSLVFSLAGQIAISAFRNEARAERSQECVRAAARVNDTLMRELRQCEEVMWPSSALWSNGHSVKSQAGQNWAVVCRMRCGDSEKKALVGYRYIDSLGHLERVIYPDDYELQAQTIFSTQDLRRCDVLLQGVTGASFWTRSKAESYGQPIVGLSFAVQPLGEPRTRGHRVAFAGMTFCSQVRARGI